MERDKKRYNKESATAGLRLIEVQSRLDFEVAELASMREGTKYPAMDPNRRAKEIQELEKRITRLGDEVQHLEPIVGDSETAVDNRGQLARDRRQNAWWSYRLDRERKVRDLKQ